MSRTRHEKDFGTLVIDHGPEKEQLHPVLHFILSLVVGSVALGLLVGAGMAFAHWLGWMGVWVLMIAVVAHTVGRIILEGLTA